MTEIGSFENQTVLKTHEFGIFKAGGVIFGNFTLKFSSIQSEFIGICRVNYRVSESD